MRDKYRKFIVRKIYCMTIFGFANIKKFSSINTGNVDMKYILFKRLKPLFILENLFMEIRLSFVILKKKKEFPWRHVKTFF